MKKSRFTEEQMVAILREADRTSVAEAAKKHQVSDATIYAWRKHFGQLEVADVKRLKALELENSRLKKLLAERDLDVEALPFGAQAVVGRRDQRAGRVVHLAGAELVGEDEQQIRSVTGAHGGQLGSDEGSPAGRRIVTMGA